MREIRTRRCITNLLTYLILCNGDSLRQHLIQQFISSSLLFSQLVRSLVDYLLQVFRIFLHYRDHVVEYIRFPATKHASIISIRN